MNKEDNKIGWTKESTVSGDLGDLSNYATKTDLNKKVSKEEGKSLVDNELIEKLENLEDEPTLRTVGADEEVFDEDGNYIPTSWGIGDKITAEKLNKIEEGIEVANTNAIGGEPDLSEISVVNSTLTLTTDKYQGCQMNSDTTIVLPIMEKYGEIHLFFTASKEITITLPSELNNQKINNIAVDKTYEFIFIHTNMTIGWIFRRIEYDKCVDTVLYSFGLLSDVHIDNNSDGDNEDPAMSDEDYINALAFLEDEGADFIAYCGDMVKTNGAGVDDYELAAECLKTSNIPNYMIKGNHDCDGNYFEEMLCANEYFVVPYNNDLFIFIGSDSSVRESGGLNQKRIDFLKSVINDNPDRRLFLMYHYFIRGFGAGDPGGLYPYTTIGDSLDDYPLAQEFIEVVTNTPNLIFCHGHSHFKFSMQDEYPNANYVHTEGKCYDIHVPSATKPRQKISDTTTDNWYEGSEGYIVDVYEGKVVFKAIDFINKQYMPEYNQVIDLNEVVTQYEYEQTNMKVYIDADEVNSSNSIMDLSPNETTLNVKNVSTTLLNGNLVFDSKSSPGIDCGFTPDLNKWTVEMYLKITNVRTDADHYYFTWGETSNRMAFSHKAGNGFRLITVNTNHYFGSDLNYDIPMNKLFHIIISHEDGYTTMFIDGNYVYSGHTGSLTSNSGTLRVGEHYSKAEDYADMELRKFRFYDGRAFTRYEMQKHYLKTIES